MADRPASDAAYLGPSLDTVGRRFPSVGRFIQATRDLNSAIVAYHMEHPLPEEFLAEHLRLTTLLAPQKQKDAAKRQDLPAREARLIALQQFRAQILAAHLKHLQTGDYTALGIAAQDALLELEGKRESAA